MNEFNDDAIIENEINYVSFKRTTQYQGDYISHEISANINPEVGWEKTYKFIIKKCNWMLQNTMKIMDSNWDEVNNYKRNKK